MDGASAAMTEAPEGSTVVYLDDEQWSAVGLLGVLLAASAGVLTGSKLGGD